ncbi:hypothetical protein BH11ARM1_BH11ARM1_03640 [soil metagenome]
MKSNIRNWALVAIAAVAAPVILMSTSQASDHADTPDIAANPGADITDLFVFPNPTAPNRVVFALNVHPLVAPGHGRKTYFDPNVLYQIKIDTDGDAIEDLVLQAKFGPAGPGQTFNIAGPIAPSTTGTRNIFESAYPSNGTINMTYKPELGYQVFAGGREDPFFFDLEQFFNILPDRATPLSGIPQGNPNSPQSLAWRPAGQAVDFLSNGGYNVLSMVFEMPRSMISGNGNIGVWATTSVPDGTAYKQMDRRGRPAVNEVLATVAYDRHKINDEAGPAEDAEELKYDILNFMTYPAHRSAATREALASVLVPDVLRVNLNRNEQASYLGVETGGATGGKFGGRALSDDIVDISLGAIFGNTLSALGLVPDDGREIPSLLHDNVDASGKHFLTKFPYLGNPR